MKKVYLALTLLACVLTVGCATKPEVYQDNLGGSLVVQPATSQEPETWDYAWPVKAPRDPEAYDTFVSSDGRIHTVVIVFDEETAY